MVAAWIRADTGVGPAMASGSQVCSGNCADLPTTAAISASPANSRRVWGIFPATAAALIFSMSKVWPARKNVMVMPMSRPMSPVRVVKNAFRAASELGLSSHQWPINMNEQTPIPSQPSSSCSELAAVTMVNMEAVNSDRAAK